MFALPARSWVSPQGRSRRSHLALSCRCRREKSARVFHSVSHLICPDPNRVEAYPLLYRSFTANQITTQTGDRLDSNVTSARTHRGTVTNVVIPLTFNFPPEHLVEGLPLCSLIIYSFAPVFRVDRELILWVSNTPSARY